MHTVWYSVRLKCVKTALCRAAPGREKPGDFQYDDGKIVGIDAVVLSTQHSEEIDQKSLQEAVMEEIINASAR